MGGSRPAVVSNNMLQSYRLNTPNAAAPERLKGDPRVIPGRRCTVRAIAAAPGNRHARRGGNAGPNGPRHRIVVRGQETTAPDGAAPPPLPHAMTLPPALRGHGGPRDRMQGDAALWPPPRRVSAPYLPLPGSLTALAADR